MHPREAKERARYLKVLSPEAEEAKGQLEEAKKFLGQRPELSLNLSAAARQKRTVDRVTPTYRLFSFAILLLAVAAAAFGIYSFLQHWGFAVYFVLFGMAGLFTLASAGALPTGRNNKRAANREWLQAVGDLERFLSGQNSETAPSERTEHSFPVPPQYAHPVVLDRMIRVIREGRAMNVSGAYQQMKEDLKALNSDVTVSQKEYDEVVTVKPMFLLCDYQDEWPLA